MVIVEVKDLIGDPEGVGGRAPRVYLDGLKVVVDRSLPVSLLPVGIAPEIKCTVIRTCRKPFVQGGHGLVRPPLLEEFLYAGEVEHLTRR